MYAAAGAQGGQPGGQGFPGGDGQNGQGQPAGDHVTDVDYEEVDGK
jgi:molecular chaperone DnaK